MKRPPRCEDFVVFMLFALLWNFECLHLESYQLDIGSGAPVPGLYTCALRLKSYVTNALLSSSQAPLLCQGPAIALCELVLP